MPRFEPIMALDKRRYENEEHQDSNTQKAIPTPNQVHPRPYRFLITFEEGIRLCRRGRTAIEGEADFAACRRASRDAGLRGVVSIGHGKR